MRQGKWILFLLSLVLVLSMSVGAAYAYFTDSVNAKGGYVLRIGYTPQITEELEGDKVVCLTSENGAPTVFVRARAYTGSQYQEYLTYSSEDGSWEDGSDGYWYYIKPLEGGSSTSKLRVHVSTNVFPAGAQPDEEVNIIVVYESTPAVFKGNGDPDFATAWANYSAPVQQQQGG